MRNVNVTIKGDVREIILNANSSFMKVPIFCLDHTSFEEGLSKVE